MDYLRKDRGEIFFDLLLEDLWQSFPEILGSNAHVPEVLSLVKVISSSSACRVSLLAAEEGCEVRLVADTGSLSNTRGPYNTTT
jgi:hypothetical protein